MKKNLSNALLQTFMSVNSLNKAFTRLLSPIKVQWEQTESKATEGLFLIVWCNVSVAHRHTGISKTRWDTLAPCVKRTRLKKQKQKRPSTIFKKILKMNSILYSLVFLLLIVCILYIHNYARQALHFIRTNC